MITGRDAERLAHVGRSQQRIAVARQRKRRSSRWFWLLIFLLIAGTVSYVWVRDSAPEKPGLIVRWANPQMEQRVSSGSTLLLRRGNAFRVLLTDSSGWTVLWQDGTTQKTADDFRWQPTAKSILTARCRAKATGWKSFVSWFWPQPELTLTALPAEPIGDSRFQITPPEGGIWLYPFIYAKTQVTWDEASLNLLSKPVKTALSGTLQISSPALAPPPDSGTNLLGEKVGQVGPDKPLWWIVPSFDSTGTKPRPANDTGTYAKLNSRQPLDDMKIVAILIAQEKPQASYRYVARLDAKPPEAILRIANNGKGDRKAWIKKPGAETQTVTWSE